MKEPPNAHGTRGLGRLNVNHAFDIVERITESGVRGRRVGFARGHFVLGRFRRVIGFRGASAGLGPGGLGVVLPVLGGADLPLR